MIGSHHKCDERCYCPLHQVTFLYSPAYGEHACQVESCVYGHGYETVLVERAMERSHDEHHPWRRLEAALCLALIDWQIKTDARPKSGKGSDCSDLMDEAMTRIKGLCSGVLDPDAVMAEIEGAPTPEAQP